MQTQTSAKRQERDWQDQLALHPVIGFGGGDCFNSCGSLASAFPNHSHCCTCGADKNISLKHWSCQRELVKDDQSTNVELFCLSSRALGLCSKMFDDHAYKGEKKHITEYTSEFQFSNNSHIQHFANDIFLSRI